MRSWRCGTLGASLRVEMLKCNMNDGYEFESCVMQDQIRGIKYDHKIEDH
jgi:hypothetical protein